MCIRDSLLQLLSLSRITIRESRAKECLFSLVLSFSLSFPLLLSLIPSRSFSVLLVLSRSFSFFLGPSRSFSLLLVLSRSFSFSLVPSRYLSLSLVPSRTFSLLLVLSRYLSLSLVPSRSLEISRTVTPRSEFPRGDLCAASVCLHVWLRNSISRPRQPPSKYLLLLLLLHSCGEARRGREIRRALRVGKYSGYMCV